MAALPCSGQASKAYGGKVSTPAYSRRAGINSGVICTRSLRRIASPPPIVFVTPQGIRNISTEASQGVVAVHVEPPEIRAAAAQVKRSPLPSTPPQHPGKFEAL